MSSGAIIRKDAAERARANLDNYAWTRHDFSWARARSWLGGLPHGHGLNIGYEAVDRHALSARRDRVALRFPASGRAPAELTYTDLHRATNRFANLLGDLGVRLDERVFVLLDATPESYVAALATTRFGAVLATLPAGRAAEAPRCVAASEPALVVTSPELYDRYLAPVRSHLPAVRHVLLAGDVDDLGAALHKMPADFTVPPTAPQWPAMVHFTAGTRGRVSGVVHPHEAIVAQVASATYALDLHDDDTLAVSVPAGRLTHTAYGMIAPLARGITVAVEAGPAAFPRDKRVSVWYAPAGPLNRLAGDGLTHLLPPSLRLIVAEGGGLLPGTVAGSRSSLGHTVHDTWWQTETGAILISNYAGLDVRPGAMGLPLPGVRAAVVRRRGPGRIETIATPDVVGELAIRAGWPSMFQGYLDDPARTAECFADGWYLTDDLVSRDADGYYWSAGRRPVTRPPGPR
ncbi:acetyl-coenzyme A synthetase [Paractinoplanes deccanensis]|uniref:Acetyl-coenzyme A synthetase n=1 Tax=Paractinoplanes deccanensis TaxID=113561 RepID=A0ABQ3YEV3_9ACTN|nr:AMP-binding protein [Actinoplanes deccanensis]GID78508.1 acetyl-coenzyme A synthetase [Actinoplanes deccanensis]